MSLALIKLTKCGAGINAISGCGYCLAKWPPSTVLCSANFIRPLTSILLQ